MRRLKCWNNGMISRLLIFTSLESSSTQWRHVMVGDIHCKLQEVISDCLGLQQLYNGQGERGWESSSPFIQLSRCSQIPAWISDHTHTHTHTTTRVFTSCPPKMEGRDLIVLRMKELLLHTLSRWGDVVLG